MAVQIQAPTHSAQRISSATIINQNIILVFYEKAEKMY